MDVVHEKCDQYSAVTHGKESSRNYPTSSMRSNHKVLVLGGSSSGGNLQHEESSEPINSLDFSMITNPGGSVGRQARIVDTDGSIYTPSNAIATSKDATNSSTGRLGSLLRGVVSSTTPSSINPRQLLSTSTSHTKEHQNNIPSSSNSTSECNALTFAKSAPLSGYLRKLGKNIPTFKRRFFVLKPSTHLYYFMSPNDTEPRGCIDLDMIWDNEKEGKSGGGGCEVREIGLLPDGSFQFELLFYEEIDEGDGNSTVTDDNASTDTASRTPQPSKRRNFQRQCIVLEARTEEIGRGWITKLQSERLSAAKEKVDGLSSNLTEMKSISTRWETSACEEAMRADEAERQRNTAISESTKWKEKYNNLNEAIRLLVKTQGGTSSEFLSEALDGLDLNGTNFSDISDAFEKINESFNLSLKREEEAKNHIAELEQSFQEAESETSKMKVELTKVREANGILREDLKKTKREKRVLVKEVKSLHAAAAEVTSNQSTNHERERHDLRSSNSQSDSRGGTSAGDTASITQQPRRRMNDEEKRLVIELEEHVMSGLRLSEQFLTLSGVDPSEVGDDFDSYAQESNDRSPGRQSRYQPPQMGLDLSHPAEMVANQRHKPLSSLLDDNDGESVSTGPETDSLLEPNTEINNDINSIVESTEGSAEFHNDIYQYGETHGDHSVNQNLHDRFIGITRQQEEATGKHGAHQPAIIHSKETSTVASSVSESTRCSRVTDNGHATFKLQCPRDDGQVYHITFYSKKIGLQFQKIPNEANPIGLLTDALTAADHSPNSEMSNPTTAELKRIANISQNSKNRKWQGDHSLECLPVAPTDAVLVCGFVGYDDSTGNARPSIGARLVAFDGIPVEVGKWTFESIRQSIKARGRPLTLSFRNDVLTKKQDDILTKAVSDLGRSAPQSMSPLRGSSRRGLSHVGERGHEYQHSQGYNSQRSQPKIYYSFSDAGSSISSAVAPLMSNLLSNNHKQRGDDEPDYLKRSDASLDKNRHHSDFQSGLL